MQLAPGSWNASPSTNCLLDAWQAISTRMGMPSLWMKRPVENYVG